MKTKPETYAMTIPVGRLFSTEPVQFLETVRGGTSRQRCLKRQWRAHVKRAPIGMVPECLSGHLVYRSAMGTAFTGAKILQWFDVPKRDRPTWVRRIS